MKCFTLKLLPQPSLTWKCISSPPWSLSKNLPICFVVFYLFFPYIKSEVCQSTFDALYAAKISNLVTDTGIGLFLFNVYGEMLSAFRNILLFCSLHFPSAFCIQSMCGRLQSASAIHLISGTYTGCQTFNVQIFEDGCKTFSDFHVKFWRYRNYRQYAMFINIFTSAGFRLNKTERV